jgi:hypothetical protein
MAGTDLVMVTKNFTDPVTSVVTNGLEERVTLAAFVGLLPAAGASVAGTQVVVTRQTAPAAAPVPFADLTAAANYVNSLRTLLIAAGVLV